jgi:hypothetical protein
VVQLPWWGNCQQLCGATYGTAARCDSFIPSLRVLYHQRSFCTRQPYTVGPGPVARSQGRVGGGGGQNDQSTSVCVAESTS